MKSITDLILRMQPLPVELKKICSNDPDFALALKSSNPRKFVSLGAVITSYPPNSNNDEVIGFLVYDYGAKPPRFKQDFIVNASSQYREFIIYTRHRKGASPRYIRDINEFFEKYPTYSRLSHHPTYDDLPDSIKPRAMQAISLADRIIKLGLREEVTDEEYIAFDSYLRRLGL